MMKDRRYNFKTPITCIMENIKKFSYMNERKLQLFFQCKLNCPLKQEETSTFCGNSYFCELFYHFHQKVNCDKEKIFKYRVLSE